MATKELVMNINDFTDKFHELESSFFKLKDNDGLYYWDLIRYHIFIDTYDKILGQKSRTVLSKKISIPKLIIGWMLFVIFLIKWRFKKPKELNILCSRYGDIDKPSDNIIGHLVSDDSANIETTKFRGVFNLNYLYYPVVSGIFNYSYCGLKDDDIANIECKIKEFFDVDLSIKDTVLFSLNNYYNQKKLFDFLFKYTCIEKVNFIQNGIMKGLIASCENNNVVSVEYQHGFIGFGHPAYSYPNKVDGKIYIPCEFSVFSDFWINDLNHFIKKINVVGKYGVKNNVDYFNDFNNEILFIGSMIHHEKLIELIEYAIENSEFTIIYKLHSNQFSDKEKISSRLQEKYPLSNQYKIITNEQSIDELIHEINDLFVINSTVIYEALQQGCRVYCYDVLDASNNYQLKNVPNIDFFKTINEYNVILENIILTKHSKRQCNNLFFKPLQGINK
ncbi:hypothetical protein VXS06_08780 [Photobacterium toruni]|uniref:Uncharacterized protein n=1 Tax=Photobacterium toruni TaxID=1935446 RepID=A0ABU6L6F0_9GAMM|nr:hypothetical protein [Photobacterium toruni]